MSSRAIDTQWGKSGLSLYNSNQLTFLLRCITPICVASTSVSVISQTPWNIAWGLLWSWHDVPVLFQNPAWQAQTDTAVSLWVSQAKYQFHLRSSSWPFCSNSPEWRSRHMVTWFGRHGDVFGTTKNSFFQAFYNPQISFTYIIVLSKLQRKSCQKSLLTLDLSFKTNQFDILGRSKWVTRSCSFDTPTE